MGGGAKTSTGPNRVTLYPASIILQFNSNFITKNNFTLHGFWSYFYSKFSLLQPVAMTLIVVRSCSSIVGSSITSSRLRENFEVRSPSKNLLFRFLFNEGGAASS